jgi:hypothetical protein
MRFASQTSLPSGQISRVHLALLSELRCFGHVNPHKKWRGMEKESGRTVHIDDLLRIAYGHSGVQSSADQIEPTRLDLISSL